MALALAACGRGGHGSRLERDIKDGLSKQLAVAITRVTCPGGPLPMTCTAEGGGASIPVTVTGDGDGYAWTTTGLIINAGALATEVTAELAELGLQAAVDCGPLLRPSAIGDQITCTMTSSAGEGRAYARIVDGDGGWDLELALDADAVARHDEAPDPAHLDELSRAYDVEGAGDEDEGDQPAPEAPDDAGP
jgi:hypothetical protein